MSDEKRPLNIVFFDPNASKKMLTMLRLRRLGHQVEAPVDIGFCLALIGRGGVDVLAVELRPGDRWVPTLVEKLRALPPWAGAVATFGLTADFTGKALKMAEGMLLDGMRMHDVPDEALDEALHAAVKARLGVPGLDPARYADRAAEDIARDQEKLDTLATMIMPIREAEEGLISRTASDLADAFETLGLPVAAHAARQLAERPVADGVRFYALASSVVAARSLLRREYWAALRRAEALEKATADTISAPNA
ncbi:hypothetical protein [Plastoroseomonas arctica]|uniref:Uncharacterized protein n=1 Tax=Plastoroseomonas arctica TaxID=1509237 RepID=A0AAF1KQB4_9PROT|nr:hypothetical protein [Plastoroseomonas arctica]MBR0657388.1 hypothetical protein [Plastoroseomonas arctica]